MAICNVRIFLSYRIFLVALILEIFSSLSFNAQSRSYFVSPSGKDNNSGLTASQPLGSINYAIQKAVAGDTVYLLFGTYREVISFKQKNGLPEKEICLLGYSNNLEEYPLIDAGETKPTKQVSSLWMEFKNSSWIKIGRIKFKNAWAFPITLDSSSYISFSDCLFWGGKRVINVSGELSHHILVENCFWDQGGETLWRIEKDDAGIDAWTSMHHVNMEYFNGSLIDFSGTGGSIVIRNNTIVNAFNAIRFRGQKGFDTNIEIYNNNISNVRDNDFEPEYYTYNLHIYHNYSHNIHRTCSIDNVEGGNIYYYGNVITTDNDEWTKKVCTSFWKIYGSQRKITYPIYAFNNSFYGVPQAFKIEQNILNVKHYNNAYYFLCNSAWILNNFDISDEFDYDISNMQWPSNIINNKQETHGKVCDVKYIYPKKNKLMLQPDSPAIDAGKIISFKEFDWTQSYHGSAPDIGAYENGNLVEGPAFRFIVAPGSKISYKEKPRIVRYQIDENKIVLYFSDEIDKATVNKNSVQFYKGEKKLSISSISFPKNNYQMIVEVKSILKKGDLSVAFNLTPRGLNGELATYWASGLKIHKK